MNGWMQSGIHTGVVWLCCELFDGYGSDLVFGNISLDVRVLGTGGSWSCCFVVWYVPGTQCDVISQRRVSRCRELRDGACPRFLLLSTRFANCAQFDTNDTQQQWTGLIKSNTHTGWLEACIL